MMQEVKRVEEQFRALDGSPLSVVRPSDVKPVPWAFRVWYTHRGETTGLASAPAGTLAGSPLPDSKIVAEARTPDGRLLALSDHGNTDQPMTMFVYEAQHFELYTARPGHGVPLDVFVDLLTPLDISDSPDGIAVRPRIPAITNVELHLGATFVPDLADLDVYFSRAGRLSLPGNEGRHTFGGEVWRDGAGVVLANDSTVAAISPAKDPVTSPVGFGELIDNVMFTRHYA